MIIIYNPSVNNSVDPIVILDYTRSDEQYSQADIIRYVNQLVPNNGESEPVINISNRQVYSLDYSMSFTHRGISYGDSLKTSFTCTIQNAPIDLVKLLNIKYYVSQQNIDSLQGALSKIIDPQVFFPSGAFVIKPNSNTNTEMITRSFIIYSVQNNGDQRRINNNLVIRGSYFDTMVIRLQMAVDLTKDFSLVSQLTSVVNGAGLVLDFDATDTSLTSMYPVVAKYYPPATLDDILNDIGRDNQIAFHTDYKKFTVTMVSLATPKTPTVFETTLCFNNYALGSKLVSTFALQDYASCVFEAEAFDVDLFESVVLYDDSFNDGQFANLNAMSIPLPSPARPLIGYRFYVLEYTYSDSRLKTSITVRGTNNWLLSHFRLDNLLEAKIYTQGGGGAG